MKKASEIRNFVIAGHAGSGKTMLSERLLFKGGAISRMGSIEGKNTVSDYTPEEQERGASIYSTPMNFCWHDHQFFFSDTPGYGEFIAEVTGAYAAADAGLVVIDCVDGPQVGTARAWRFARLAKKPRAAFVNRVDRDRADFAATLEVMRGNHGKNVIIPLTYPVGQESGFSRVVNVLFDKEIPPEIAEPVAECRALWLDAIAETDEELMMRYLDGETLSDAEIAKGLRAAVLTCRAIPVFAGSVTKDVGIDELLQGMIDLFPTPLDRGAVNALEGDPVPTAEDGPGEALVFKAVNDPFIGQLAFFRVFTGRFATSGDLCNLDNGVKERVGQFLLMNGKNSTPVSEIGPGYVVSAAKLKNTRVNQTLATVPEARAIQPIAFPNPVMNYAISAAKPGEDEKIASGLAKLSESDPAIRLARHPETHELLLSGMGDQHLAIVGKKLKDQYKAEAVFAVPRVPYRETITANGDGHYRHKKQTGGAGQFAEVYLKIAPNASGYEFANEVVGGNIPKNFIPAVEKGVADMLVKGPLVGCVVENVRVVVYDGKYHPVDSNEMAFRTAARMAFREAMQQARPVLLEPIMTVRVLVPEAYTGDISGDLNHKRGRILGLEMEEGMQLINAEVPMAELSKYATEIRSITQGKGSFEVEFSRYEQVPPNVANEIIAAYQATQQEG